MGIELIYLCKMWSRVLDRIGGRSVNWAHGGDKAYPPRCAAIRLSSFFGV
jgi:hypothetical protein